MFPRKVKDKAMIASGRTCCLCEKYCGFKMECHHIVPKAKGGQDTFENCIPLCFDCHAEVENYNDQHPKGTKYTASELIARRDRLFEQVRAGLVVRHVPPKYKDHYPSGTGRLASRTWVVIFLIIGIALFAVWLTQWPTAGQQDLDSSGPRNQVENHSRDKLKLVLTFDSTDPRLTYVADGGRTNSDQISDALAGLAIKHTKENTSPRWSRIDEIKVLNPHLAIMHINAFQGDGRGGEEILRAVVTELASLGTSFLFYSRGFEFDPRQAKDVLEKQANEMIAEVCRNTGAPPSRTRILRFSNAVEPDFRSPPVKTMLRKEVISALGLPPSIR
jgi:hypothetical protein